MTAIKKILAFILCLAMLLSMNAAAFADEVKPFSVGEQGFDTLKQAYDALPNEGGTITMNKDAQGPGLVVSKPLTIDFNGFCYSLTEGVGSEGTESNGLQLLQESDSVTLKNGKLEVHVAAKDKFYILVQNYADLTVEDMELDGTNLDKYSATDGDSYTLSINSGKVVIDGEKTVIKANDEGDKAFAFDVFDHDKYEEKPLVTLKNGDIQGKIEVHDSFDDNTDNFIIEGGTFSAEPPAKNISPDFELKEVEGKLQITAKSYAAKIGETGYETFDAALAAATGSSEAESIVLLADVEKTAEQPIVLNAEDRLELNKHVLKAHVEGTVSVSGGTWLTPDDYKMLCPKGHANAAEFGYVSDDLVINVQGGYGAVTMLSGSVELGMDWRTLPGQSVTVNEGASFSVPAGKVFGVYGSANVKGSADVQGSILLGNDDSEEMKTASMAATVTVKDKLGAGRISSGIEGLDLVLQKNSDGMYVYSLGNAVAKIGDLLYTTLDDAVNAAQSGDTIVLNKDYEAGAPIVLKEGTVLDINNKVLKATVSGDVLLKGGHLTGLNIGDGALFEVTGENGAGFKLAENRVQTINSGEVKLIGDYAPGAFYVASGAKLSIAEGKALSLSGTSVFDGSVSGTVKLSDASAVLKCAENSGVVSGVEGMMLIYAEGTYRLVNANAVAKIGSEYYDTFGAAYEASAGSDKTIVLLQDITVNNALDLESRTLELGGSTVTLAEGGSITGKVIANGAIGDVISVSGSADYISEGANVTLSLNNVISLNSGKLTVNCDSPLFSVAEGAELIIAEGKKLSVLADASVTKLGGKGIIELAAGVSLTAPKDLNVSCADTAMMAVYHGGVYKQVNKSSTVRVGDSYYAHLGDALADETNGEEIVLLADQSIGAALDLSGRNFNADGKHIYLAQGGSLKAPAGLDVSSGVDGMNVHYGADGVYVLVSADAAARIGDNFYDTLELAAAAEGDIVLLKDASLSAALDLGSDKLDLNGKKVTGSVTGTVIVNGGAVGTSVVSSGSGDFISDGATVKLSASVPVELVSGKLTLNKDLTVSAFPVASGAELIIASGKTLTVSGAATFAGKLTISGKVLLASKTASITAASGLTIGSALEDCKVSYASGAYKLIDKIYLAQVGEKKFETMEEALAELAANPKATLKLLMASNENIVISKDATVSFNSHNFTGKLSVKDGAKLTISEADLLALGVNGVSADKASVIVGKNEVKLSGKVTIDAKGTVTATPSGGAVGINSVEVTVPANGAVVSDKDANVSLPKGSKVAMNVKSGSSTENIVIDIINSGALAADGSVTATMVEIDGVSYGKLPVKRGAVDMLYFAPYEKGETSFVFKLDGTVLAKSEGERFEYLTDGNDADLYPDLEFTAKKSYFQTGTKKSLTATCNGFFDDLYSLKLVKQGNTKGEKIALNKDIVIKEGSTEVEIKNVCLSKLTTGKYDLILTYKAGDGKYQDVKFSFEVGTTPATGDSGFGGFAAAMAVSAMGAFAVLALLKKKGNKA